MSTALIDRTLSYTNINPEYVDKNELIKYIDGVFSCGADYIEINSTVLKLLDNTDFSEKYIFRINSIDDIKLSIDYKFAYISLPIELSPFFKLLSEHHSIIAEIHTNEYSVLSDLLSIKESTQLKYISMIRLTGIISTTDESTNHFLTWYKSKFYHPLDICPINTMLTGSGDAISFYSKNVDAISLSFGRNNFYTSMEDFIINRQILKRSFMPQEIISAICTTSLAFLRIFSSVPCGMERIVIKDSPVLSPVYDAENGMIYRPFKASAKKITNKENIIERQIKTIGLEREIEDAILDMLKKTNYSFYQNIIKRNIID